MPEDIGRTMQTTAHTEGGLWYVLRQLKFKENELDFVEVFVVTNLISNLKNLAFEH